MEQYETVKLLGSGSYGECFLVRHKETRVLSVLKRMLVANDKARRAAHDEARLLSSLKHPNIVEYHKSFEMVQGAPPRRYLCVVMQYCDGGDLLKKLLAQKGQLFPEKQVVDFLVQTLLALEYMHSKRVLHRDIKTQNIFLTKNNVVKLGDFGISKVLESPIDLARTVIGTPYYMSPEILGNRPYGYKSDIWAMGCVLYEMMCLKHAFEGKDYMGLVNNILRGQAPPVPGVYSTELRQLVHDMLQKVPSKRPSARDVLNLAFIKRHMADAAERLQSQSSAPRPALNPMRLAAIQPQSPSRGEHRKPRQHDAAAAPAPEVRGVSVSVSARKEKERERAPAPVAMTPQQLMPPPAVVPSEQEREIHNKRTELLHQLEETHKAKEDLSEKLRKIRQQRIQEVIAPRSAQKPQSGSPAEKGQSPPSVVTPSSAHPVVKPQVRVGNVISSAPIPRKSSGPPPNMKEMAKDDDSAAPDDSQVKELEEKIAEADRIQSKLQESLELLADKEKDEEEEEALHLVSSNLKLRAAAAEEDRSEGELSDSEENEEGEGNEPDDDDDDTDGSMEKAAQTLSFPPKLPGPLTERLPILTRHCIAGLGAELFSRAYKHVKDNSTVDAEDPSLIDILGQKSFLGEAILSVVFMEDQLQERVSSSADATDDSDDN